jgi:hypothetical protein
MPVAGRDVQYLGAGAQIQRLAELLADDLQGGADDGGVGRRPGGLLPDFQRGEIRIDCTRGS